MDLNTFWFLIITILFCGFFFLEGFDYGVGILLPLLGKTDKERRAIINTIGPVWDGNEVWMITAGAALIASFPEVYATLTSSFYLALMVMIIGLIIRGVAFEYRSKYDSLACRKRWDWVLFTGSLIPAYAWGLTVSNLMRGLGIEGDKYYYGGLAPLLNPFALVGGLFFVGVFILHGASFLNLKLSGELIGRVRAAAKLTWPFAAGLALIFLVWTYFATDILFNPGWDGFIPALLAALGLALYRYFLAKGRDGWIFISGGLAVLAVTIMIFSGLFPRIMISTIDPAFSLTIYNSAASLPTLRRTSILFLIFLPLVMLYQGWTYWIFRQRISPDSSEDDLHY
jgi:cytochrome d ubiquinol oxidase subunit II